MCVSFGHAEWHAGCSFPDQELNRSSLHWELGVLTTGPPGKPPRELLQRMVVCVQEDKDSQIMDMKGGTGITLLSWHFPNSVV